jgi:hypothetical protein
VLRGPIETTRLIRSYNAAEPMRGDARGRGSWHSSFLDDPDVKFLCEKLGKAGKRKKEGCVGTAELNRRDPVTAPKSWPNSRPTDWSRGR